MLERTPHQFEWMDNSKITGVEFKRRVGQHIFLLNHGISIEIVSLSGIQLAPFKLFEPHSYEVLIHEEGIAHKPSRLKSYNVYRLRGTDFIFAGDQTREIGSDYMNFVVREVNADAVLPEVYSAHMKGREDYLRSKL